MKQSLLPLWLTSLLMLLCQSASAYDFDSDGLYYNITSSTDLTVEVTYKSCNNYTHFNDASGDITIPSTVTYSGKTYSVTNIDNFAFEDCSDLTSIDIPNSVTSIGRMAFDGCTNLQYNQYDNALYLGNTENPYHLLIKAKSTRISSCEINTNCHCICESAFPGCLRLTCIDIPNSVTSIGGSAFSGCTGLTNISIGNSVTSIGYKAFEGCTGLTDITIPNSVTFIDDYAFQDCTNITKVYNYSSFSIAEGSCNNGYVAYHAVAVYNNCTTEGDYVIETKNDMRYVCDYIGTSTSLTLPSNINGIAEFAFYRCTDLTSINIPDNVVSIGSSAFKDCTGLTSITFPDDLKSMGDFAFSNCTGLTSITIPDDVESVGDFAFSNCTGLTSITLPDDLILIGKGAFRNCTGLTSLDISNELMDIDDYAFYGCTGLTNITFPNEVVHIGEYAFYGCTGQTNITFPNEVVHIGEYAFYGWHLTTVTVLNPTPFSIGNYAFTWAHNIILYVPKGSKSAYEAADYWKEFREIREIQDTSGLNELTTGSDDATPMYSVEGIRQTSVHQQPGLYIRQGKKLVIR